MCVCVCVKVRLSRIKEGRFGNVFTTRSDIFTGVSHKSPRAYINLARTDVYYVYFMTTPPKTFRVAFETTLNAHSTSSYLYEYSNQRGRGRWGWGLDVPAETPKPYSSPRKVRTLMILSHDAPAVVWEYDTPRGSNIFIHIKPEARKARRSRNQFNSPLTPTILYICARCGPECIIS